LGGFICFLFAIYASKKTTMTVSSDTSKKPIDSSKLNTASSSVSLLNSSASSSSSSSKANWDTSKFREDVVKVGYVEFYKNGLEVYQREVQTFGDPESASEYFENAFKSLQKISGEYTNNPVFYFNMLECAMGFNFNVAIENGYKFFKLAEYGENFSFDQMATILDTSRKMYKLLLAVRNFDEAEKFAGKTAYVANKMLKRNYNEDLELVRDIAMYFYINLSNGNYAVQENILTGFDSPEPWINTNFLSDHFMMGQIRDYYAKR
jgi:hypothetical protein